MARIVQLLEIDLNGASFRLEIGGLVALCERTFTDDAKAVALVRVSSLEEAERLETYANALHATFRWKQGHVRAAAISVDDFERQLVADPKRFVPDAAWTRLEQSPALLQLVAESREALRRGEGVRLEDVASCDHCGIPLNAWGKCDVCGGIENNIPGKHD